MPKEEECHQISQAFERVSNLPMIIGCIDGTHIPIKPPKTGYRDFVNRKGWPSYNVQAVVDDKYRFGDISCKYPGCTHDAHVFKNSGLYKFNNEVIPKKTVKISGTTIGYYIIGDPAYPIHNWLLKGYVATKISEEDSFNVYLNKARVRVENSFGRLKARWRILQKTMELDYKKAPNIILTSCILHNIVEDHKQTFYNDWYELTASERQNIIEQPQLQFDQFQYDEPHSGENIRNALKYYLASNFPLLKSIPFRQEPSTSTSYC